MQAPSPHTSYVIVAVGSNLCSDMKTPAGKRWLQYVMGVGRNLHEGIPAIRGAHKCVRSAPTKGVWGHDPQDIL